MSQSAENVSQNTRSSRRPVGHKHLELKKKCFKLKVTFPHEIPSAEQVKLLHPGIRRVITASHETPKTKLSHHCFVVFEDISAAEDALNVLNEKKVEGGVLIVHRVKDLQRSPSLLDKRRGLSGPGSSHKTLAIELIIHHLPQDVGKADIKKAFHDSSKIKVVKKRKLASFCVPTLKSAMTYLVQPVHTIKGQAVELTSRHPLPKPTKPRSTHTKKTKTGRVEKMDQEPINAKDLMDTSESEEDTDTEMGEVEQPKRPIVVEECF